MTCQKPQEPLESDCCGQGCNPCVFDIYRQDLARWEKASNNSASPSGFGPDTYWPFELTAILPETPDTNVYRFSGVCGAEAGQHLIARVTTDDQLAMTRQFTVVRWSKDSFDLMIKVYPDGRFSKYVRRWRIGTTVEFRGPFGHFDYARNRFRRLVMLAAGTGLAPMIPVIRSILDDENDETRIHLFFCCSSHLPMREELKAFSDYWNFRLCVFGQPESVFPRCTVLERQRLTKNSLLANLQVNEVSSKTLFLVCGTRQFEAEMTKIVKEDLNAMCHKF